MLPRPVGDPLHHIDVRFEPFDPIFDADEEPQLEFWPRKRRSSARAAATAIGILLGCSAGERPRMIASVDDGIDIQASDLTSDEEDERAGTPDENPDPADESGEPSDPGVRRAPTDERGLPG